MAVEEKGVAMVGCGVWRAAMVVVSRGAAVVEERWRWGQRGECRWSRRWWRRRGQSVEAGAAVRLGVVVRQVVVA